MLKLNFFPEQQFINRIKSNDQTVLGELFIRFKKPVFSYIRSNGGSEADAEDMLQEAIIVLWQNVCGGKFELRSKLGTYILAVVKNKWRAEKRKRNKISNDALPEDKADGRPSLLEDVIEKERAELIHTALQQISPGCKELLLLFYFEARDFKDIARIMNYSGAEVAKAKKYQCKKSLEEALKNLLPQTERKS